MSVELLKGNVALAEAAVRAGVEAYFGYPITPQTELLEHMAKRMPELGRVFVQAESEVAAINMVYGAASTGVRAMTSSSSPGISLMQEGFSYIAGSEVPCVIVDIMRGGPGLGNIQPSQADYFQVTRSAGHGDYHPIVLAPASVQEAIDLMTLAFDLADQYRHLVFVVADGLIGQMMEPAELPPMQPVRTAKPDWALTGAEGRDKRVITSLELTAPELEAVNLHLQAKLQTIRETEQRWAEQWTDDARLIVVGYGTAGRIAETAVRQARKEGLKVGLFRPISLWPFPEDRLSALADQIDAFLVVEMNAGQMWEDVRLAAGGQVPVMFAGRMGGMVPMPEEIYEAIQQLAEKLPGDLRSGG
ncbi:3-methyl-2-oxobutanoate dehydrogenase subunit VorB [Aggregatilinea lenta]|uniref:3-methyl-2-oxobutanoate dehydrogenase subunit VorB n=1 Tax=Aggregatilinea lenta TaxID=913108 RepID=UPI000E5C25FC|nr:3-methyl-2-oxobutanoate dehydrogenase subunit VorB [Aggregatilinea lenta]